MPTPQRKPEPTFADFDTRKNPTLIGAKAAAQQFCRDVKANPYGPGYSITFIGPSGTGKTMLMRCIMSDLGRDKWGKIQVPQMVSGGKIASREAMKRDWRKVSDGFKTGEFDIVEAMIEVLLLAIDDIGADYDKSKIAASKLDRVYRARSGKWNVTTTNLALQQIAEQIDSRVASFLIRDGNIVREIEAGDYNA